MKAILATAIILLALSSPVFAQTPTVIEPPFPEPFQFDLDVSQWGLAPQHSAVFQFVQPRSGPLSSLQTGLPGTWWRDPEWVKTLTLTMDQQKKMDDAFQQYRLKLIDLNASLEKEELILEPLVQSVRPEDQQKTLAQIDRVAEARAELEKANARMLLGIREVLTQDQWSKLPSSNRGKFFKLDLKNGVKVFTK
jgi:Spy/CpxP family protein refolding chaperone